MKFSIRIGLLIGMWVTTMIACPVQAQEVQEKWAEQKPTKETPEQKDEFAQTLKHPSLEHEKPSESQKRWRIFGKLGYTYDSNVILASDKKGFRSGALDLNANRYSVSTGIGQDLFRDPERTVALTYGFAYHLHDDSLNQFNFQNHLLSVEARQAFTLREKPAELKAGYEFSHSLSDRHSFSSSHAWPLVFRWRWHEGGLLTVYENLETARFRNKGFNPDISSRDGFYQETGIVQTWFLRNRRRSLSVGYEFALSETDGRNFDSLGHGGKVIFRTPLIEKIALESSFYVQSLNYHNFAVNPQRHDVRYHYQFRLNRPLADHWLVSAFYARTDQVDTHGDVNGQFNYERNLFGIEISFRFEGGSWL